MRTYLVTYLDLEEKVQTAEVNAVMVQPLPKEKAAHFYDSPQALHHNVIASFNNVLKVVLKPEPTQ